MARINAESRKKLIFEYYNRFHDPRFLEWDPLSVIREYSGSMDQEYIAMISAIFAFGGVKQIIASVRGALNRLQLQQSGGIVCMDEANLSARLQGFTHRIYVDRDLVHLSLLYQRSCAEHGSLHAHFRSHHQPDFETIEHALSGVIADFKRWSQEVKHRPGPHFKHMLNSPVDGSTCKRWLMFLKWMIRPDDGIDLGLWSGDSALRPDQLLIPLDTHLFKISKKLGLTHKRTANWRTAIEVTRNLKKIDPADPTRFDFSLCRFGMFDYRKLL